jgi:Zn finger protein HypA/HybF involved in hydrogenase expression
MICPKCDKTIRDSELIRLNSFYLPGMSTPVEFAAGCPHCQSHIGKVSWGRFVHLETIRKINDRNRLRLYVCPSCQNDLTGFFKKMKGKEMPEEDARCPQCKTVISKVVLGRYI